MSLQKDIFLQEEGDRYWKRNREKISNVNYDPVMNAFATTGLLPKTVLEIGCANGWRLNAIKQKYQTASYGIDPSADAIHEGQLEYPDVILRQATADSIPFDDQIFDVVIFGFCLYLCDRRDLYKIAYEADRVLGEEGHIAILDFAPPFPYQLSHGIFNTTQHRTSS